MDVYRIRVSMPDGTGRNTHTLAADARDAQRAFHNAARIRGFKPDWATLVVVGNDVEIGQRHKTPHKRLREFECAFLNADGTVDSDVFEARCATHAQAVARKVGRERNATALIETITSHRLPASPDGQ
ncbi:hypothetical protein [Burkholderia cepacia]|uniref:hypothetical protein n=1 Tax=Burkholderia cepacia TaxID=292 RepID=UPI0012D9CA51|nr:hypothetical protein [Burkholderia cepacia]